MEKITIALEAGIGLAGLAAYVLFKLKKIKKKLRSNILRGIK